MMMVKVYYWFLKLKIWRFHFLICRYWWKKTTISNIEKKPKQTNKNGDEVDFDDISHTDENENDQGNGKITTDDLSYVGKLLTNDAAGGGIYWNYFIILKFKIYEKYNSINAIKFRW